MTSGDLHKSVNAAADILMCQREHISLKEPPKNWVATVDPVISGHMREILDKDALWLNQK